MDEQQVRAAAEAHAQAVVDGDMDRVMGDIVPEARESIAALAGTLKPPVLTAAVAAFTVEGETAAADIRYTNADDALTLRSFWTQPDASGPPRIVAAEIVAPTHDTR